MCHKCGEFQGWHYSGDCLPTPHPVSSCMADPHSEQELKRLKQDFIISMFESIFLPR